MAYADPHARTCSRTHATHPDVYMNVDWTDPENRGILTYRDFRYATKIRIGCEWHQTRPYQHAAVKYTAKMLGYRGEHYKKAANLIEQSGCASPPHTPQWHFTAPHGGTFTIKILEGNDKKVYWTLTPDNGAPPAHIRIPQPHEQIEDDEGNITGGITQMYATPQDSPYPQLKEFSIKHQP